MSFWSDPWGAVTGETNHIVKSVEGEANTVKHDVGGYIHHDVGGALAKGRAGLGHAYAYAVRPALPLIGTVAAAVIPGGQVFLPYLMSYDVGAYGHALATKGISGFEQVNSRGNIEAGLITAATYGSMQALGYGADTAVNASSGMSSTEVTENLANPAFDPLSQTAFQVAESSAENVYATGAKVAGLLGSTVATATTVLGLYNKTRHAAGQPTVNILGNEEPSTSGLGYAPLSAGQESSQQAASSQSSNPATAGGGFGNANNGNDSLAWTVAIALGVAAFAG